MMEYANDIRLLRDSLSLRQVRNKTGRIHQHIKRNKEIILDMLYLLLKSN